MIDALRSPIRSSAFLAKEIFAILREPRMILTLALGPFLILLLFGIGFHNATRPFRALFVAPSAGPVAQQVQAFGSSLGPQLVFAGMTDSETEAKARLQSGDVDLVIVVPQEAQVSIRNNQQAVLTIYHNELDPLQASYVDFSAQLYTAEVNRRILEAVTAAAQTQATSMQGQLGAAQSSAQAVQTDLQSGNVQAARQHQNQLAQGLAAVETRIGTAVALLSSVEEGLGHSGTNSQGPALLGLLNQAQQGTDALGDLPDNQDSYAAQAQTAGVVAEALSQLRRSVAQFAGIQPAVLVSPFKSKTENVSGLQLSVTDFYAPGVLALLLQHIAVTFAALSIVAERQTGTIELFRVAPVSAGEVLLGKYASYMLFGGVLAAILLVLLRFGLGVPMLGSWLSLAGVIVVLLFASLSIGFVFSFLAKSDGQAIQFGMLMLLASVLFSGFFTALYLFTPPVRALAYLLPVTYGIQLFQGIMLRGEAPNLLLVSGLLVIGLVLFVVAWLQANRLMARR